jgi:hypothetical protein
LTTVAGEEKGEGGEERDRDDEEDTGDAAEDDEEAHDEAALAGVMGAAEFDGGAVGGFFVCCFAFPDRLPVPSSRFVSWLLATVTGCFRLSR